MDRATPSFSRRNILIGVAGVAAAGVVATSRLFRGADQGTRRLLAGNRFTRRFLSLADAEQDEWAAQVGSTFTLEGVGRLKLAGIRLFASAGARPPEVSRQRAFAAVFDVLGGANVPGDRIYTARHSQYGRLPLFLQATDSPGRVLAIFN